jgi:hypothetical protein
MNSYKRIYNILTEGKEKQADIKSDKELTRAGASSSSDPKSKRYSPSLRTVHNSPENIIRRKHGVVTRRSDRANKKHAQEVQDRKDAIRAAQEKRRTRASKKTQASALRALKKEADTETGAYLGGGRGR